MSFSQVHVTLGALTYLLKDVSYFFTVVSASLNILGQTSLCPHRSLSKLALILGCSGTVFLDCPPPCMWLLELSASFPYDGALYIRSPK